MEGFRRGSESISPTAHYTGYVWFANGMSHPAFATNEGRLLYHALRPANLAARAVGGPSLEGLLIARHRVIDHLLETEIAAGRVGQVLEIAAGLSPRGWRFAQRHGNRLLYVEADLRGMVARKREVLAAAGAGSDHHRVVEIDALADDGPHSLEAVAAALDPGRGLAIVTEGLLAYYDAAIVVEMWRRFASVLAGFTRGVYLAELYLADDNRNPLIHAFKKMLSTFVRGEVHLDFADAGEAQRALVNAGFPDAALHRPSAMAGTVGPIEEAGARHVRVIEARPART